VPQDSGFPILREAGEAIGNVGRRVFRRRKARQAEETIQRWLEKVPLPQLAPKKGESTPPEEDVIDVKYYLLDKQQQHPKEAADD
jgi:hypothetical protein